MQRGRVTGLLVLSDSRDGVTDRTVWRKLTRAKVLTRGSHGRVHHWILHQCVGKRNAVVSSKQNKTIVSEVFAMVGYTRKEKRWSSLSAGWGSGPVLLCCGD